MLTARLLENMCLNFALASGRPRCSPRIRADTLTRAVATIAARTSTPVWKPINVSSRPPRKKPTPFSAFFEPVRIATHL